MVTELFGKLNKVSRSKNANIYNASFNKYIIQRLKLS